MNPSSSNAPETSPPQVWWKDPGQWRKGQLALAATVAILVAQGLLTGPAETWATAVSTILGTVLTILVPNKEPIVESEAEARVLAADGSFRIGDLDMPTLAEMRAAMGPGQAQEAAQAVTSEPDGDSAAWDAPEPQEAAQGPCEGCESWIEVADEQTSKATAAQDREHSERQRADTERQRADAHVRQVAEIGEENEDLRAEIDRLKAEIAGWIGQNVRAEAELGDIKEYADGLQRQIEDALRLKAEAEKARVLDTTVLRGRVARLRAKVRQIESKK